LVLSKWAAGREWHAETGQVAGLGAVYATALTVVLPRPGAVLRAAPSSHRNGRTFNVSGGFGLAEEGLSEARIALVVAMVTKDQNRIQRTSESLGIVLRAIAVAKIGLLTAEAVVSCDLKAVARQAVFQ
jgi:hypothetical protein